VVPVNIHLDRALGWVGMVDLPSSVFVASKWPTVEGMDGMVQIRQQFLFIKNEG
jgi:hypothetical protein